MKTRSITNARFALGLTLVSAMMTHSANGQYNWNGGTGDYDTGGNWDTGLAPDRTDGIRISSGAATKTGNLERTADTLIDGGDLVISNGRFLNARSGPGDFTLSSGSLQQTGNYFIVGTNDSGTFTQTGGSVAGTVDRGFFLSDGGGSTSSVVIRDGDFSVEHNGPFNADLHNTWLGRGGQNDSILVDGGNFSVSNTAAGPSQRRFYLTRDATFQIDSGTAMISDMQFLIVGRSRAAGTSSFIVNGGQTQVGVNSAVVIGGGVNGEMAITAGTIDISQVGGLGGNLWIDDSGSTTSAIFTQSGGILDVEGDIVIGRSGAGTTATYTMTGGELHAAALGVGAHPNPLFEFLGGEIFLQGDQTPVINEAWFAGVPGTTASFDGGLDQTHIFVIPEPTTLTLLGFGAFALGLRRRRA